MKMLAASNSCSPRRHSVLRATAVEGAVETYTFADMTNQDHMRAFFRRASALLAFVALLRAVHVVNWITGSTCQNPPDSARVVPFLAIRPE
jgi:hypothetical protein